ncbi:MAG TPA: hypothetical protein VGG85_04940 [Terracidiphilus sp.]|jgi:hypothetical protein
MTSPTTRNAHPRFPKLFLLVLLLITLSATARAQVSCGGEGQSVCTIADDEFYTNNNYAGCQYDLKSNGGFLSNLVGDSSCVNQQRYSLTKGMTGQMDWVAWALSEQRNGIGRNEQLNWITTAGTHNSYSNSHQGYTYDLGQNQVYSITDQLNAGARILELDPHTYNYQINGGHLTVCHGSNGIWNGVHYDDVGACILTSPNFSREFQAVLGEINFWMTAHPSEVLVVFIDAGGPDSNYISGHEQDLDNDIVNVFGPSLVWSVADTVRNKGHVPSIALMQSEKKQIIFVANTFLNADHVHTFDLLGHLATVISGVFPSNNSDQGSFTATNCQDGDGHDPLSRGRDAWFRLGEGRSTSDWKSAGAAQPLVNEAEVQAATACAASYVELDFLYARDQVPTSQYAQSGPDNRFESGVWSWESQDYGQHGPALMTSGGRWASTPTLDVHGAPALYRAACVSVNNTTVFYGKRKTWTLTNLPTTYANAPARCANDHPGSTFSAPVNGYENQQVSNLGSDIWLNYQSKNLGDPYASQSVLAFQYPQGTTPASQTFQIIGQPHKTVNVSSQLPGIPMFLVNGQPSSNVTLDANGAGIVTVSMLTPQNLSPSFYVQFMRMEYTDGKGQASTLGFEAFAQIAPSIALNPPSKTSIVEGDAWTPTVTLNLNPNDNTSILELPAPGTVKLVEQMIDSQGKPYSNQLLSLPTNLPGIDEPFTLGFSSPLVLRPGTHNIFAQFLPADGDSFHSRVVSNTVVMNVSSEMSFAPARVNFHLASPSSVADPKLVNISGQKGTLTIAPYTASWLWAGVSSNQLKLDLTSAAKNLAPGVYTINIGVVDQATRITDFVPVTLTIEGTLVSTASALNLAASTSAATARVEVKTVGDGALPLDIQTPSWMTWTASTTTTPADFVFSANPGQYTPGTHLHGNIIVKSPEATNAIQISVDFYIVEPTQISATGHQPTVTFDGSPLTLPASLNLVPGTHHTLAAPQIITAPGQTGIRWVFKSWNNAAPASFSFTAGNGASSAEYAVTYGQQDHFTVGVLPSSGGTVSVTPSSPDGFYDLGSQVTLTATPNAGYSFLDYNGGWFSTDRITVVPVLLPEKVNANFISLFGFSGVN